MASRSSLYSTLLTPVVADVPGLKMPDYVFGGGYGDLETNQLQMDVKRIQAAEAAARQEEADRQRQFEEDLASSFETNKPTSLRDAYSLALDQAGSHGQAKMMLDILEAQDRDDKQSARDRIQAITMGPSLMRAGMTDAYGQYLKEIGQNPDEIITPEAVAATRKTIKSGSTVYAQDGDGNLVPILTGQGRKSKDRTDIPYVNQAGDVQFVDPDDTSKRRELLQGGFRRGEAWKTKEDPLAALLGSTPVAQQNTDNQKRLVDDIAAQAPALTPTSAPQKTPPPRPLPGESYEAYKRRVNGR